MGQPQKHPLPAWTESHVQGSNVRHAQHQDIPCAMSSLIIGSSQLCNRARAKTETVSGVTAAKQ